MPGLRLAAAVLLAVVASNTLAAEAEKPRPKIALVLSGGGARGFAHIGVLKVLREARVPVDFIVATSMGSIVGGAYAAGNTPEQMEALLNKADWDQIFSDRAPREYLTFRRKEDDLRLIGRSELGLKGGTVVLPRGAFGSQNLEEFLREASHPATDARTLNDLPILFRAVATDLESGKQVVLENVPLPIAMRASMSVPGAFAPSQVDGRLLGDGGLVRNLPVEVARDMGADIIIAVNVGTPLLPREALSSAFGVAQQMVNILTEQNVAISLAALRRTDVLISPDLNGVNFVDFERGPDLIVRGEVAAREVFERLAALGWEADKYAAWEAIRTRKPELVQRSINEIVVQGAQRTNPDAIKREIASRADLVAGGQVTDEQLLRAARILHGWGEFERVDVRAEFDRGFRNVVVDVDEKPWGPNYLRFGFGLSSDFQTDARFLLTLQHTMTWVNSWGAEWRNELTLGDTRRFATSFYQPLGAGSPWFVEPFAEGIKYSSDVYDNSFRRTDRLTLSQQTYAGTFGLRLGNSGVARLGGGYQRYRVRPLIGTSAGTALSDSARVAIADVTFDTLDDPNFPRRGYIFEARGTSLFYKGEDRDPVQTFTIGGFAPVTFGRLTLLGIANAARSRDDRGGFSLGGLFDLSGTPAGSLTGSQAGIIAGLAYYRTDQLLPKALGRNVYVGMSLEAGNAWQSKSAISHGDLKKAASVFVGLDSILGPLYLAWGQTFGGQSAFYLFLGRPTDRIGR
jgi:NTE family protein